MGYANLFEEKSLQFQIISPNDECLKAKQGMNVVYYILGPLMVLAPIINWLFVQKSTTYKNHDYESFISEIFQFKFLTDIMEDECPFCVISIQLWLDVFAAILLSAVLMYGLGMMLPKRQKST